MELQTGVSIDSSWIKAWQKASWQVTDAIAIVIGARDGLSQPVVARKRPEEIGGEILVERRVRFRAAAGGFAVAFRGEKSGHRALQRRRDPGCLSERARRRSRR